MDFESHDVAYIPGTPFIGALAPEKGGPGGYRGEFMAWDATTGKALWYSQIGALQSPPETFMLDGKQHFLFSAAGSLYMFVLN